MCVNGVDLAAGLRLLAQERLRHRRQPDVRVDQAEGLEGRGQGRLRLWPEPRRQPRALLGQAARQRRDRQRARQLGRCLLPRDVREHGQGPARRRSQAQDRHLLRRCGEERALHEGAQLRQGPGGSLRRDQRPYLCHARELADLAARLPRGSQAARLPEPGQGGDRLAQCQCAREADLDHRIRLRLDDQAQPQDRRLQGLDGGDRHPAGAVAGEVVPGLLVHGHRSRLHLLLRRQRRAAACTAPRA